jgi:hypothetical protein
LRDPADEVSEVLELRVAVIGNYSKENAISGLIMVSFSDLTCR